MTAWVGFPLDEPRKDEARGEESPVGAACARNAGVTGGLDPGVAETSTQGASHCAVEPLAETWAARSAVQWRRRAGARILVVNECRANGGLGSPVSDPQHGDKLDVG